MCIRDRILDAYNANPSSMKASIASLAKAESSKEKVLVLGDMKELGSDSISFHQEIINYLGQFRWKSVFLIGKDFGQTRLNRNYHYYNDYEALATNAQIFVSNITDTICLIKASRSLKLERISQMLED